MNTKRNTIKVGSTIKIIGPPINLGVDRLQAVGLAINGLGYVVMVVSDSHDPSRPSVYVSPTPMSYEHYRNGEHGWRFFVRDVELYSPYTVDEWNID